jgi:hypothetical protein
VTRKQYNSVTFQVLHGLKNVVFWVIVPYVSFKNRRFGVNYRLLNEGDKD